MFINSFWKQSILIFYPIIGFIKAAYRFPYSNKKNHGYSQIRVQTLSKYLETAKKNIWGRSQLSIFLVISYFKIPFPSPIEPPPWKNLHRNPGLTFLRSLGSILSSPNLQTRKQSDMLLLTKSCN